MWRSGANGSPVHQPKLHAERPELMFAVIRPLRTALISPLTELQSQTAPRSPLTDRGFSLNMSERAPVLGEVPPAQ